MGNYNLVSALSTLAFNPRRRDFFTKELVAFVKIIDAGHMSSSAKGSWAGAFGNFQFMPTTFASYAVDGDGDGKIDLVGSHADAFASAANYLARMGWRGKERWGRPVTFDYKNAKIWQHANTFDQRPMRELAALGLRSHDGKKLQLSDMQAMLVAPDGQFGPAFLVYENHRLIMRWNASTNYALSIGLLADLVAGENVQVHRPEGWSEMRPLLGSQIIEVQEALKKRGLYESSVDGIMRRHTYAAVKKYQNLLLEAGQTRYGSGVPIVPDGYPSVDVYMELMGG